MKTLYAVLIFIAALTAAATRIALAADAPKPAVASQSTGTGSALEGPAITVKVPIFSSQADNVPLAMVNDEPITLGDLTAALGAAHEERDTAMKQSGGKIDYDKILERLINVKLVIQEARRIGFDELPEFKSAVEDYSTNAQAEQLMREVTKDVKADPAAVEKLYKELVVEWKIKSILFEKEEDAKSMAEALKAGTSYEELTKKAVAENKAKSFDEAGFVKPKDLSAHIMETLATMETGSVSPIVRVQSGKTKAFTIMKLEEKRYPDDPKAREQAERTVLASKKAEAWEAYKTSLVKKYVKVNDKIVNGLDYDANYKKMPEMLKDKRVIAEIKGEKPITVGDLTDELANKFWHGPEQAAKAKKINKEKRPTLFLMIGKRLIAKDVLARGIDKSDEYLKGLKAFEDQTLFGLFVERVVMPDVKVTEAEVKAYFEAHQKEYQYPEMMKVSSLAFGSKRDAESALKSLKKGSDMNWVRSNADGVVAKSEDDPLTSLSGSILSLSSMPKGMSSAVAGARAGEYRLYEGNEEGRFYVLSIDDAIPARPQPYEEVRGPISEKVFNENFVRAMEDWFQKLRSASSIKIYFADSGK
jgi:hypothetical protein